MGMNPGIQQQPDDQASVENPRQQPDNQTSAGTSPPKIGTGQWIIFFVMIIFFIIATLLWIIAVFPLGIVAILTAFVAVPGTIVGFFQLDYFKTPGERTFEIIGNYIEAKSMTLLSRPGIPLYFRPQATPQKSAPTQKPVEPQQAIAAQQQVPPQKLVFP